MTLPEAPAPPIPAAPSREPGADLSATAELVVDIAALGVTTAGRLRQPSFLGVRTDVGAEDLEV